VTLAIIVPRKEPHPAPPRRRGGRRKTIRLRSASSKRRSVPAAAPLSPAAFAGMMKLDPDTCMTKAAVLVASATTIRWDPLKAWVAERAPGVFVIDGKINPDLEADWRAEHVPS
jgi:hypothetical protein